MKVYNLERKSTLPITIDKAWSFFSDPKNLAKITPDSMNFEILTKDLPPSIYSGLLVQYTVTPLLGLKMKWLTEIKHVNKPFYFIDEQKSGPYTLWYHEHSFSENGSQTIMTDKVSYALPFSILGNISHSIFVRKKIESIFDHREKVIADLFK